MSLADVDMSFFETILARRSVRSYLPKKVDEKIISTLLESAVRAPTAMHREPWAFIIIQDRQLMLKLSDKAKSLYLAEKHQDGSEHFSQMFNSPDFNIFYDASTLILICGKKTHFAEADCWLAAENMMLSACAMGLGTCVIGCALPAFDDLEIRKYLKIGDDHMVIAPIIVGYQNGIVVPNPRKSPVILFSIN